MTGEVAAPSLTTHAPRPPWRPVRAFDRPLRRPPRHAGEARPAASAHFGTGGPALLRPCRRTATAPPLVQGRGVPRLRRRCRPQRRCLFSFGCITRIVPIIAEHGERAGYVRNIRRDPRVRVRLHVGWRYRWVRAAPRSWPMTTRSRANETSSAGTPCARSTRSRSASSAPTCSPCGCDSTCPRTRRHGDLDASKGPRVWPGSEISARSLEPARSHACRRVGQRMPRSVQVPTRPRTPPSARVGSRR